MYSVNVKMESKYTNPYNVVHFIQSQRQKDEAILRSFLSIYGTAISSLERLERDLFKVKTEAQDEYVDLGPRVHFHTNVALRGR